VGLQRQINYFEFAAISRAPATRCSTFPSVAVARSSLASRTPPRYSRVRFRNSLGIPGCRPARPGFEQVVPSTIWRARVPDGFGERDPGGRRLRLAPVARNIIRRGNQTTEVSVDAERSSLTARSPRTGQYYRRALDAREASVAYSPQFLRAVAKKRRHPTTACFEQGRILRSPGVHALSCPLRGVRSRQGFDRSSCYGALQVPCRVFLPTSHYPCHKTSVHSGASQRLPRPGGRRFVELTPERWDGSVPAGLRALSAASPSQLGVVVVWGWWLSRSLPALSPHTERINLIMLYQFLVSVPLLVPR